MPNIPYEEFSDFHVRINHKVVYGSQPVEGAAFLSMKEDFPNCVRDILVACRACFRYRTEDGTVHTVLLHEEIQRNATPFDDDGIPPGEYEFPFSFRCPDNLPPSITVSGGWDTVLNCKVWYEVRAYVMHAENHPLDRKHLRTSIKFQRCMLYNPLTIPPSPEGLPCNIIGHVDVKAKLASQIVKYNDDVVLDLSIKHDLLRNINSVKVFIRQVMKVKKRSARQVREFMCHNIVQSMSLEKNVPIKRGFPFRQVLKLPLWYDGEENKVGIGLSGSSSRYNTRLAPSIRLATQEGVEVFYCVEVRCSVMFSNDHVFTIPFVYTDKIKDDTMPPGYWAGDEASVPIINSSATEIDSNSNGGGVLPSESRYSNAAEAVSANQNTSASGAGPNSNSDRIGGAGQYCDEMNPPPSYDEMIKRQSLYPMVDSNGELINDIKKTTVPAYSGSTSNKTTGVEIGISDKEANIPSNSILMRSRSINTKIDSEKLKPAAIAATRAQSNTDISRFPPIQSLNNLQINSNGSARDQLVGRPRRMSITLRSVPGGRISDFVPLANQINIHENDTPNESGANTPKVKAKQQPSK